MRGKIRRYRQLEILNRRMMLTGEDGKDLLKYRLGYAGELQFDKIVADLGIPVVHLKDYRFRTDAAEGRKTATGPAEVQIDNIIISDDQLYTFEIKNHQHDMEYGGDRNWRFAGGKEIITPMNQIDNHRNVMTSLMQEFNFQFNMINNLVFIHPEQTIYNLPNHQNIYVRSNLMKRLKYLLKPNRYEYSRFIEMLDSRRVVKSAYDADANVTFEELAGGVFCRECENSRLRKVQRGKFECMTCHTEHSPVDIVRNLIQELQTINSTWQLSSSKLEKYSGYTFSSATIRRYRQKNLIEY